MSFTLPKGYDEKQHYPVVVLLHGQNQEADDIERLTRFNELADKDSVIAVYPSALHGRWNFGIVEPRPTPYRRGPYGRRRWGYPGGYPPPQPREQGERRRQQPADDIDFFNHMLDKLSTRFSVDTSRIYFAGLSDGGFMTMKIGCGLTDRVAGIATVGAAMPKTMVCVPSRPLPVLMISGTDDPVVKYNGGTGKHGHVATISAEDSAKEWAKLDRCGEKPAHSKLDKAKGGLETKIDTYGSCQENAEVSLYSVKGGGNTWPGGEQYEPENTIGKTSQDFNANEVIWSFLVKRHLTNPPNDAKPADQKPVSDQKQDQKPDQKPADDQKPQQPR
ncbi:MAG TPA: PHB depolymerase family esterase [Candidatus Solibacter sp.]|nr:PHB depolymerase family esterase [Candidatus Solibacter sp.]